MTQPEFDMNEALRNSFPGPQLGTLKSEAGLDQIIADVFPTKYQRKTARIIADVCEASDKCFSADQVAQRLSTLVKIGVYAGYGNLDKWAFSEIGPIVSKSQ